MNVPTPKDPRTRPEQVHPRPTHPPALDETAEPDGQFPHAGPEPPSGGSVDAEDAHVGATEEQVGDRTGPGAGYDETSVEPAASVPQGGQGMGQGRGANAGQQKPEDGDEAEVEEKRQDPPEGGPTRPKYEV